MKTRTALAMKVRAPAHRSCQHRLQTAHIIYMPCHHIANDDVKKRLLAMSAIVARRHDPVAATIVPVVEAVVPVDLRRPRATDTPTTGMFLREIDLLCSVLKIWV